MPPNTPDTDAGFGKLNPRPDPESVRKIGARCGGYLRPRYECFHVEFAQKSGSEIVSDKSWLCRSRTSEYACGTTALLYSAVGQHHTS